MQRTGVQGWQGLVPFRFTRMTTNWSALELYTDETTVCNSLTLSHCSWKAASAISSWVVSIAR